MATFTIPDKSAVTTLDINADKIPIWQGAGQHTVTAAIIAAALTIGTAATVAAKSIASGVLAIRTTGYASPGDGGGALYVRVGSAPTHAAKLQSADGAHWEYTPEGRINILVFGADRTGTASCTTAINNMIAYGNAKGAWNFYAPRGVYLISVTPTVFPSYTDLQGDGIFETIFRPGMTDGTACLKFGSATRAQFFNLGGFSVATTVDNTNFAAGTAAGQNCTGIDAADGGVTNAQTRFMMHDIYVYGCAIGVRVFGWLVEGKNLYFQCNELAFKGSTLNASTLNMHMENNRRDLEIISSFGLTLENLHIEPIVANALASTIDGCNGVTLTGPYFESNNAHPRAYPMLIVGGATECIDFNFMGASIAGSSGMNAGVPPILLDKVNGGRVSGFVADGAQGYGITTTANTRNLTLQGVNDYYMLQDTSKSQGPAVNYFANPRFDAGVKGWGEVYATRATMSMVATPTRRGPNAVKIQATAGPGFNYGAFRITGPALDAIKGKTVRVAGWIWVPDLARFAEASRAVWPSMFLQSYNGSTSVYSASKTDAMVKNAWNHYQCTLAVQSNATYVDIFVYVNQDSATADGTEYLVVDEITMVDVAASYFDQYNGNYINSESLPRFEGGAMRAFGTVAAFGSSTGETYAVGDIIWNSAVAALGTPGYVCTTGGVGGVAVWSSMGALV